MLCNSYDPESDELTEQTQLITAPIDAKTILARGGEFAVCIIVAIPTAVLNGLAAISGDTMQLGALTSLEDLKHLLSESSAGQLAYGVIALIGSEAVLFFLNKRYLVASAKAAVDLVRRTLIMTKSKIFCSEISADDKATLGENVLFIFSMGTSLIFAEMGGKALSFLGTTGIITGFSLSLSVYFTTRFAGANLFFANIFNENWRLKNHYLDKLELLAKEIDITTPHNSANSIDDSLNNFLQKIDSQWETLPKDEMRVIFLQYTAPILGYTLAFTTIIPIFSGFVPESVQGTEMLIHTDIGNHTNYQNVASFTLGTFLIALTLLFYELNIKELPKHVLRTAISIYENLNEGNVSEAMKLFSLTFLALGASFLSGLGFRYVAMTSLTLGYFSYLGGWLSNAIPDGLFTAVIAMLWSHLQELINQTNQSQSDAIMEINRENASFLLKRQDIDLVPSGQNIWSRFFNHRIIVRENHNVEAINSQTKQRRSCCV